MHALTLTRPARTLSRGFSTELVHAPPGEGSKATTPARVPAPAPRVTAAPLAARLAARHLSPPTPSGRVPCFILQMALATPFDSSGAPPSAQKQPNKPGSMVRTCAALRISSMGTPASHACVWKGGGAQAGGVGLDFSGLSHPKDREQTRGCQARCQQSKHTNTHLAPRGGTPRKQGHVLAGRSSSGRRQRPWWPTTRRMPASSSARHRTAAARAPRAARHSS